MNDRVARLFNCWLLIFEVIANFHLSKLLISDGSGL